MLRRFFLMNKNIMKSMTKVIKIIPKRITSEDEADPNVAGEVRVCKIKKNTLNLNKFNNYEII